jgi:hypothetical protein
MDVKTFSTFNFEIQVPQSLNHTFGLSGLNVHTKVLQVGDIPPLHNN